MAATRCERQGRRFAEVHFHELCRQGPPLPPGNGTIRTYLLMDGATPIELGVAISEEVLQGADLGMR